MVLSPGYLLTELNQKVRCHAAQIDALNDRADKLGKQAITIENKLEEDIDLLCGELLRRKEVLKEVLWQIVTREDKQFARKKAEIMEHVNVLKCLEETASEDIALFRELYGNAAERSDQLDVESDGLFSLGLSCDFQQLVNAIKGFGQISYNFSEQGDLELFYDSHSDHGSKDQPHCVDVDITEVQCHGSSECAFDPLSCDPSSCCNHCDVSDEPYKTITGKQIQGKDVQSHLQQWLLQPKGTCSLEGDAFTLESKIINQLESLQLTHLEDATEMSKQEALTMQCHEDAQCSLISTQKSSLGQNANVCCVSSQTSLVSKVWDDIKDKQLISWLKTNTGQVCATEEKGKVFESSVQLNSLQSSKYSKWLKDPLVSMETELQQPSKNVAQYENIKSSVLCDWLIMPQSITIEDGTDSGFEMESVKEGSINYGVWLKRKYGESSEEQEMQSAQVFKKIKNMPLESWLKKPGSHRSGQESGTRSCKIESKSVERANLITRTPLKMWLKCKTMSGSVAHRKYSKWLVPRKMVQKGIVCDTSQSTVLQQFDEISKSCLSGWVKNVEKVRKPSKLDLCKWLKSDWDESSISHYSKSDPSFTF